MDTMEEVVTFIRESNTLIIIDFIQEVSIISCCRSSCWEYTELKVDITLRVRPFKESVKKDRFNSVKSDYDGIHIFYNNMRAYPSYLIEYEN